MEFTLELCLSETLAVWLRSAYRKEQNVEIAKRSGDEGIMDTLAPACLALYHLWVVAMIDYVSGLSDHPRDDCSAHDGHVQEARTLTCKRAQLRDAHGKNARKHDRVEQADRQNGPHRHVAVAQY